MKKLVFFVLMACLVGEEACDIQCPAGHKLTSFVDGNQARCLCLPESEVEAEQPSGCPSEDCSED